MGWGNEETEIAEMLVEAQPGLLAGSLIAVAIRRMEGNHLAEPNAWDGWTIAIFNSSRYLVWARAQGRGQPPPEMVWRTLMPYGLTKAENVCYRLFRMNARVDGGGRIVTMPDEMVTQLWSPVARECRHCGAPRE